MNVAYVWTGIQPFSGQVPSYESLDKEGQHCSYAVTNQVLVFRADG